MPFRSEITSLPDARNKMGKVVRVSNGLIDIATVGGNGVMRGIRCAGVTPQAGDKVLVTFYKNGEILATAISSSIQESAPITTLTINTGDSGGGSGTVSSVALSMPSIFAVGGSPITASGTLAVSFSNQTGHHALLGPNSGTPGAPTFRAIQAADLPADVVYLGSLLTDPSGIFDPTTGGGLGNASFVLSYLSQAANKFLGSPSGAAGQPGFRTLAAADMAASVNGTSGTIAKFTGTNVIGNSILTESGAALSAAGALTLVGQSNANQFILKGHSTQTAAQIVIQSDVGTEWLSIRGLANGSVMIGKEAGPSITSADSIAIGYRAMNGVTSSNSIAIGTQALEVMNTSGHSNIAVGYWAGKQITGGLYNVLIGEGAGYSLTTGINNFMLGTNAGWNLTGSDNVCIGAFGMYYSAGVSQNTAIGSGAGVTLGGDRNTVLGYYAGYTGGGSAVAFSDSVYIGTKSGYGSNAGSYNTAIGTESLQKVVANAVAVGYKAGFVQTGAGFTAVGYQAGIASTSGANSTLIGSGAGASLTTNGGAVMIGYQAGGSETAANKLYIHNSNSATPLIYGDFSTPSLTFNATVNIQDGKNIVFGGTTGSKLGSTAAEKLGAWGATPIVQPTTGVAAATFVAGAGTAVNDASTFDGYTIKQIVKALRNIGWLA